MRTAVSIRRPIALSHRAERAPPDGADEVLGGEGLREEIPACGPQQRGVERGIAGDEEDRHLAVALREQPRERRSGHVGEADVEHKEVGRFLPLHEQRHGVLAGIRPDALESCVTQDPAGQVAGRQVVVDHEDGLTHP